VKLRINLTAVKKLLCVMEELLAIKFHFLEIISIAMFYRHVCEMIHIIKQNNELNKQSNTKLFLEAYLPLLNLLSPI